MYDVKRLQIEMLKRGLTETGLAKKAKMPQSTVNQLFRRGSGHPNNIRKICKALGFDLEDVVMEEQSA